MTIEQRIEKVLEERKQKGEFRTLHLPGNGVDFTSNDYLGLSRSAWIAHRMATSDNGVRRGATGSRLLSGNSEYVTRLEERIASFHEAGSALLFTSGYNANLGLIATLCREGDVLLYDEAVHASMHQGMALSKAGRTAFAHNDVEALRAGLEKHVGRQVFVLVESVYSMDGDHAPLTEIAALRSDFNFELIVDEAHALGIYGKQGRGRCDECGIADECLARIYTFGKALGSQGAVVVGPVWLREYLINFCKPVIYSTAMDMPSLAAVEHSYEFLLRFDYQRNRLLKLIQRMKHVFRGGNTPVLIGDGPIFGLLTGPPEATRATSAALNEQGFYVRPIVYPTVPRGRERIRISLHSFNTERQMEDLADAIGKCVKI